MLMSPSSLSIPYDKGKETHIRRQNYTEGSLKCSGEANAIACIRGTAVTGKTKSPENGHKTAGDEFQTGVRGTNPKPPPSFFSEMMLRTL